VEAHPRRVVPVQRDTLAWIVLVVVLGAAARFLYVETRGATFWFDEWDWVLERRGNDLDTFLEPHNGHLSLIPIVIYRLLLSTFGIDVYGPYRLMVIGVHLICVALVFMYASRRVGGFVALLAAALILFLGPAWNDILWPFQVGWLISLGTGVGALLMLDRRDRAGDITASALLAASLASCGLGLAIAAGIGVDVLSGRRRWRDAWIVAAPLALYGLWWLPYQDAPLSGTLIDVPGGVADSAAASISALAGLGGDTVPGEPGTLLTWGRPLAVLAAVVFIWRVVRVGRVPARVLALLTVLLSFWIATELSRGDLSTPYESRYLYVGGLFIVLIAVELARGVSPSWRAGLVLAAAAFAATVSNVGILRDGGEFVRREGQITRAVLGAVEVSRALVKPGEVVSSLPGYPFLTVSAGSYFAAAQHDGTPAATPAELATQPWYARIEADRELIGIQRLAPRRATDDLPPLVTRPTADDFAGGRLVRRRACLTLVAAGRADSPAAHLQVSIPPGGLLLKADEGPAEASVRRLADSFQPVGHLASSAPATLRIRPDRLTQPWRLRLEPTGRVTVCGLA
jgi:hypothetical protein